MLDSIQQSSPPGTATGQPPTTPRPSSIVPATTSTATGQPPTTPGPSSIVPTTTSTATGQRAFTPGQSQPLKMRKYDMGAVTSRIDDTLDDFKKYFEDPIWTELMGYAAVIRTLPSADQNRILSGFGNILEPYQNK